MINIVKACSDLGIDIDGARFGPDEIMKDLNVDVNKIYSVNIEHGIKDKNSKLKNLTKLNIFNKELYETISNINKNEFVLTLGGDHSISIASVLASQNKYNNLGIIWIDAHLDYNTINTTITGNIHGLPLAAINGLNKELTIFHDNNYINPINTVVLGYRSVEINKEDELNNAKEAHISILDNEYINNNGIAKTLNEAIKIASNNTNGIHISFDLDVIDKLYAPGVSVSEDNGLNLDQINEVIKILKDNKNIIKSMDIVEYNPLNDIDNKTKTVAQNIIKEMF